MDEADQIIQALENKAKQISHTLNPINLVRQFENIEYVYNKLKELRAWLDKKIKPDVDISQNISDIRYTGNHTDIANIGRYEKEQMPCSEIGNIKDEQLRISVKDEFDIARKDGYVNVVNVNGVDYYELTEKGKEHINSQEFIKHYEKSQVNAIFEEQPPMAEVKFQGNSEDLNVFRYTDKIDTNNQADNIQNYFQKCKDKGFVNIDEKGIVKPTEKTINWLENKPDLMKIKGNIRLVTKENIDNIMQSTSKVQNVAKTTDFAKKATQTAKAVSTSAKVAGAGAKTAGVASGAVTAGVGTIITISAEAAQKLVDVAKKSNQQMQQLTNK